MSTVFTRTKGKVRFAFKESNKTLSENKKQLSLIYLNFTYGNQRFKYSTGYKSCFDDWDFNKQRVKIKNSITNKDEINTHLNDLESFLYDKYSQLSKEHSEVPKHLLKYALDVKTNKVKEHKVKNKTGLSFFQVIDEFINSKEGEISNITIRSYKQTKKRLEEYQKHYKETLMFEFIDMDFYNKFNRFMENNNYSLNTIGKHIKTLKTFLNYALIEGYTKNQRFKSDDFKVKKEITTEIYLTDDEIKQMHNKDLSKYPELEHARDVFLIGCYTGQRISDYNGLKSEDIVSVNGYDCFKIRQKKNRKYSRTVHCPITKEIKEIMNKRHNGKPPKR